MQKMLIYLCIMDLLNIYLIYGTSMQLYSKLYLLLSFGQCEHTFPKGIYITQILFVSLVLEKFVVWNK